MNRSKFIPQPQVIYMKRNGKQKGIGVKGVFDENLIRREYYNPNKYPVRFVMMTEKIDYIKKAGITPGWKIVDLPADGFCILNHGYYICEGPKDELVSLVENRGKQIGIGNKLPSKPVVEKGDNVDA